MGDTVDVAEAYQCPSDLIDIQVKRMYSETYTLRVDRSISIVELKERIACISGVISGLQLLIFRGRVLKDDQFLSDYHVEGGHILYLVVRRPIPRLSQSPSSNAASDPILSPVDSQRRLVIPNALTIVSEYLRDNNSQTSRNSMGNEQGFGPTRENRIPIPSLLDNALQTRRQLLVGEVAESLSNISMLLADPLSRRLRQGRAVESETNLTVLGNSLIQLGHIISRFGRGERPAMLYVANRFQLEMPRSWLQTSNGAGNLPLATAPSNAVLRRQVIVRYFWPLLGRQQHVRLASSESQNAVNTSSTQLTTEAEVEGSGSDSDSD